MTEINRLAPSRPLPRAASSTRQTWWCEHAWLGGDTVANAVAVTVEDGVITAVQPGSAPSGRTLRGLVIPGLANVHSHAFHRALRSRTQRDRGSFWTWRRLMYAAAGRLTPERYRDLARAVYAEMALAGITAVGEFHYLHHDTAGRPYADPNAMGIALIDAADDAGIRLTLLDTCYLSADAEGSPLPAGPQQRFSDGDAERWACRVESLHAAGTGIVVGAALHSVRAVPVTQMAAVVDWAARRRAPLHIHSSEQTAEVDQCLAVHGCTPTALMREHGVLGERTTAVHATHLSDRDIDDLRHTSTGVCFCPTTERDLGDGVGPAGALIDGRFSLGSDSQAVIDLFEEARAVELDERLVRRERGLLPARRLLASATADGHGALGDATGGVLRAGAPADLVALDLHSVRTAGGGATVENVVFACAAVDVTDVVVSGRIVVADRVHTRIPDVGRALATAVDAVMEER
jgi:formiminoglutamate deiminase